MFLRELKEKIVIAKKETDEYDEENPIKYLATNRIDAPIKLETTMVAASITS